MNNEFNKSDAIREIVDNFYSKAINDVFIGYHFRKVSTSSGSLVQNLEDFKGHLPKIYAFWEIQFGLKRQSADKSLHLFAAHDSLNLRQGEIGRWVFLFKETITEYKIANSPLCPKAKEFLKKWEAKLSIFQDSFIKYYSK